MNKYLLLRDNKQSGPYSCDELQQKGLKAYDLVWAEGKSAAWRYPSEIEELRAFAPAVEEQPFDRFYKKPVQQTSTTQVANSTVVVPNSAAENSIHSNNSGKRIIYVTMPAGKTQPVARESVESTRPVERQAPIHNNPAYQQTQPLSFQPATGKPLLEDGELSSLPVAKPEYAEEKLVQPSRNWKNDGENTTRIASRGNRQTGIKWAVIAACTLVLLAAGVFIGMSIDKHSVGIMSKLDAGKATAGQSGATPPPVQEHPLQVAGLPSSNSSQTTMPLSDSTDKTVLHQETTKSIINEPSNPVHNAVVRVKDKGVNASVRSSTAANMNVVGKDSGVTAYAVAQGRREASHRTDMSVEKMDKDLVRNNLSNLVSIGSNKYQVGAFGGISDLQLTVSNRSVYPLDLVVVEVQYIQANKKVFKTENMYFRGIGAGSALMQEAPKSSRGIKVQYKITLVNSKELGLSYSAL